jgi:glyoxylase-like metal-dependent hydrolase (beta-lactamase superfamily II)/rhodanese-related sulfurtransferase
MPHRTVPHIPALDLAHRLDAGERLQLLDIRAPERVAQGRVTLGATLDFRALPASEMYRLPTLEPLHLDRAAPVAVICGHGNSSKQATTLLRERGFDAYSVAGGMAAWDTVYLPRPVAPTPSLAHMIQVDRVGKGALSYVLVSDGDAIVVDPGRHVDPYEALLRELGATAAAVVDTHMHADYLSGARAAAARWRVPYFVHPDDACSPYDGAAGRIAYQPLTEGDTIAFGRATLRAMHVPGHTLGSIALVAEEALALTGDFMFVQSVGRPDLGGQREAWTARLWDSLERARREWPGDLLVLPAHYGGERERRADRSVAARFDVIAATNEAVAIRDAHTFRAWVAQHSTTPPDSYRTIKLANLGLLEVSDSDADILEFGSNQCAVG